MIKLKKLLQESSPGFENRKFGDPLPTLADVTEAKRLKEEGKLTESSHDYGLDNAANQIARLEISLKAFARDVKKDLNRSEMNEVTKNLKTFNDFYKKFKQMYTTIS